MPKFKKYKQKCQECGKIYKEDLLLVSAHEDDETIETVGFCDECKDKRVIDQSDKNE